MKKATSKKVLLRKQKNNIKKRHITLASRPYGLFSLYEIIKQRNGVAKVCIIRAVGGIGDILMTTPTLIQLKREFPQLHLTYAIDQHTTPVYTELLYGAWFIDELVDARYVQRDNYDAWVDISAVCIRYERRDLPPVNRIDLFARACGVIRLRNKVPFYTVGPLEELAACNKLRGWRKNGTSIVVLHSASFEGKRSWTPQNCLELIRLTEKKSPDIQFLVMDFNKVLGDLSRYANCYDISDLSIREKAALIKASDLFIGPDSGPMHLAGAVGTKAIVLFGSIPPAARINYYSTHEALQNVNVSCLGCWYEACPIRIKCMTGLTAQKVYNKMIEKLGG